jgi:hypothetical protein
MKPTSNIFCSSIALYSCLNAPSNMGWIILHFTKHVATEQNYFQISFQYHFYINKHINPIYLHIQVSPSWGITNQQKCKVFFNTEGILQTSCGATAHCTPTTMDQRQGTFGSRKVIYLHVGGCKKHQSQKSGDVKNMQMKSTRMYKAKEVGNTTNGQQV